MRTAFLLAFGLAAAPLAAQTASAPQSPPPGEHHHFDPARFEQKMAEHRAHRAADLATVLALKPGQRPALDQWLAAVEPQHGPMGDKRPDGATPPSAEATTPEKLAHAEARLAERQSRETARIDATKHFYASLDPQQQRVFDALERLRHGDGPHHGGMHDHHGPGGPGGDMPPPPQQGE